MTKTSKTYMTCAETAKLVRKALKAEFAKKYPGVKFSVRSKDYSGGASINVSWTDGPTAREVKAITSLYTGATFGRDEHGNEDIKTYNDSLLADEHGNVQRVHFGADFIFTRREVGSTAATTYRREIERFVGHKIDDWQTPLKLVNEQGAEWFLTVHEDYDRDDRRTALSRSSWRSGREAWSLAAAVQMLAHGRAWHGTECPGGGDSYCDGCGRWQGNVRSKHLH